MCVCLSPKRLRIGVKFVEGSGVDGRGLITGSRGVYTRLLVAGSKIHEIVIFLIWSKQLALPVLFCL